MRLPFLLVAACLPVLASAGTLYRCEGADGIVHYGNNRLPGANCRVAANYAATAPASSRTPVASPARGAAQAMAPSAPARRVHFQTGTAESPPEAPADVAGARVSRGAVYTYVKDGITHYTNVRPRNGGVPVRTLFTYIETCYACGALPGVDFSRVRLNTEAYAGEIRAAAAEFGVEEALVRAIIHAESSFNPNAVSHKGAQGLMQLIPATASRFGVQDPFDPVQNIRGGVQYLRWLLDRFGGDVTLAAAGYNAGEGNVERHGGVPPFDETQRYVERVATLAGRYRGLADPLPSPAAAVGAPR